MGKVTCAGSHLYYVTECYPLPWYDFFLFNVKSIYRFAPFQNLLVTFLWFPWILYFLYFSFGLLWALYHYILSIKGILCTGCRKLLFHQLSPVFFSFTGFKGTEFNCPLAIISSLCRDFILNVTKQQFCDFVS